MNHRNAIFLVGLLALALAARPMLRAQTNATPSRQSAGPARFAFGGNATEIPAEFIGNLVFLPVRVNLTKPSLFELDSTAAASSIDPDRLAEIDLPALRSLTLNLTGVDIPLNALPAIAKTDFGEQVGRRYQGSLGCDFLNDVVVEVDYARQTVRLYDPSVYRYSGKGTSIPLGFAGNTPVIRAKFNTGRGKTLEADFGVNTALDATVLISDHYAEAHRVFASHIKTIPATDRQLGNAEGAVLGRLKEFQLGPYTIEEPIAAFSRQDPSAGENRRIAGEIGGGILRRFTVIFDVPHQQVIFEPNIHLMDDDQEDKSGLSVIAKGPALRRFEITQVQPGTPAAAAGLRQGDVIAGIDNEAAADLTLADIRDLFRHVDRKYKLLIERNGQTLQVTIQMRHLL